MKDPEPEPPSPATLGSNSQKLCETINVCCFKSLRYRVICYAAIKKYYRRYLGERWENACLNGVVRKGFFEKETFKSRQIKWSQSWVEGGVGGDGRMKSIPKQGNQMNKGTKWRFWAVCGGSVARAYFYREGKYEIIEVVISGRASCKEFKLYSERTGGPLMSL